MKHILVHLTAALVLIGTLAACNTPSARIRQNQTTFNRFPAHVQNLVRAGEIEIGFTPEMVRIAKGLPDRTYDRHTAAGLTEVWSYVGKEYWTEPQRVSVRSQVRDSQGRSHVISDSEIVDVRQEREYERFRIEFVNGKVFAIEELRM